MPASKTLKHKTKNTHRFLTFSERISQVSIDAVHRIVRINAEDGETENKSKFQECLLKWKEQDRSLHFRSFHREVMQKSKSYNMVVHYRKDIIECLMKHLAVPGSLALESLCELLVSLCIDLRSELYLFFPTFFKILTSLLNTKEVERLEWIFNSVSMLFKYLWRYMIKDMDTILAMYSHLICGEHPPHIAAFAAESISFLLRKVKDGQDIYKQLFELIEDNENACEGVARVFFHVVKSTKGTFYSSTEKVLQSVYSVACCAASDSAVRCISSVVNLMAEHSNKALPNPMWSFLLQRLDYAAEVEKIKEITLLLTMCQTWCKYKGGILILEPEKLIGVLEKCFSLKASVVLCELLNLCESVILAEKNNIGALLVNKLLCKVVDMAEVPWVAISGFWKKISFYVQKNSIIEESFLKFCHKQLQMKEPSKSVVVLLAHYIVANFNVPDNSYDIQSYHPTQLDFTLLNRNKADKKIGRVLQEIIQDDVLDYDLVWCALLVIQHVKSIPKDALETLSSLYERLRELLQEDNVNSRLLLAVMRMTLQTVVVLAKGAEEENLIQTIKGNCHLANVFIKHSKDQNALLIMCLLIQHNPAVVKEVKNGHLHQAIICNLSSSDPVTRKLSLEILCAVHPDNDMIKDCLMTEVTPATVQNYRKKVLRLGKVKRTESLSHDIAEALFRFLVANLYINFSSYWPFVQDVITSFIPENKNDSLWRLLFDLLEDASRNAVLSSVCISETGEPCDSSAVPNDAHWLVQEEGLKFNLNTEVNPKVDYFNHRMLLWITLGKIPHKGVLESYNKCLIILFFKYLEDEHYKVDKMQAPSQNLCSKNTFLTVEQSVRKKREMIKALIAHLEVFSGFTSPASCYKPERLKAIYEQLLMHEDVGVQLQALKCYLTFRNKYLDSRKEMLMCLLDEKKVKEAMVHFELSEIDSDERKYLIPALLRLMYGRMTSKSGLGFHGKGHSLSRKSIVLRFLSSLSEEEMQSFVFLALGPLRHCLSEKELFMPLTSSPPVNPSQVVPLSRQRGIVGTVMQIVEKHSNQLSKYMFDYLLKLLLLLISSYDQLLSLIGENSLIDSQSSDSAQTPLRCEKAVVEKRFSPILRHLSKDVQGAISALISAWPEGHTLKAVQIENIFSIMVNPHIHKLKHECISQPTSLMQFFNNIARQSRFIPILAHKTDKSAIPMGEIINVLLSEKTSVRVCTYIMDMIQAMLDVNKEENEKDEVMFQTLDNVTTDIFQTENLSHAEIAKRMISVYAKEIMNYFIRKMKTCAKSSSLMQSQLKVLDVVSEYVTDREMSLQLTELFLNHVSGIIKPVNKGVNDSEKSITPVLQTLTSIQGDSRFIPLISKLFSCIKSRQGRLLLVDVLQKCCQDASKELKEVASFVSDLNSWDKRFVEKIDFDTRLAAFQEVNKSLSTPDAISFLENDCITLLPILHCAVFTLFHHNDDMSLRVSSTRMLELIINLVLNNTGIEKYTGAYRTVMSLVILPRIQNLNASEHEVLRHEGIQLLVTAVKLSSSEMSLSQLAILCNANDPDADFFENVRHIQFHRRTRAFRKLAQVIGCKRKADDRNDLMDTVISHNNVSNYLLPLAVQTLKYQDLSKHQHLKDACLETVSSSASIMPWSAYQKCLLQNLAGISKYSLGVRIVCAILEAFHFDVSSATEQRQCTISTDSVNENGIPDNVSFGEDAKSSNTNKEAKDIYDAVVLNILPRLYSILSGKLESDSEHKLANATHYTDIDQCTARAPLAVAIVSALKKLPEHVLKTQLPQVLLKIIMFLRHRYHEIRSVASKTVTEMTGLLGPCYVKVVLQELKTGLARGYQRHVLMHTVNCVLTSLCSSLTVGDLHGCVGVLIDLLVEDLFGKNEAERNVDKITVKIPEARGRSKAYNVFKILARFAKKETLLALISPLKNILDSTHDHGKRKIVDAVLMEINQGLLENTGLTAEDTLIFLHGLLTENLPVLFSSGDSAKKASKGQKQSLRPKSCLLLPKEPGRYGTKNTKKTHKTNLHLIIEFALLILNNSLKRQVISLNQKEHLQMLDPLVTVLLHCLKSAHRKTVIESTRCLTKLFRSSLPSMEEHGLEIVKTLFCTLREHSRGSGNSEVAGATFKALSVICSTKLGEKLTDTQLQVLLGYAEEDLFETNRKSHAFNVIRSILALGLKCDEILDVVDKLRAICIQTHDTSAMNQARQVYLYFMLHYPMSKSKFSGHLEFVLAQLTFEHESGRLSALELIASLISAFPLSILTFNAGMLFVPLATVLVNDECVKCRKLSSHIIKQLLGKLPVEIRDQLFSFVLHWYTEEERLHQQLAAMLTSIFIEAEEKDFHRHLVKLFPLVTKIMSSMTSKEAEQDTVELGEDQEKDHFVFHQISAVHSIIRYCISSCDHTWDNDINELLSHVENLLLHPHTWIRIACCQIYGTVFSNFEPAELVKMSFRTNEKIFQYFAKDLQSRMKLLSIQFCKQIQSGVLDPQLAEQCIKNLLFVVKVQQSIFDYKGVDRTRTPKGKNTKKSLSNSKDTAFESTDTVHDIKKNEISFLLLRLVKTAKQEAAYKIKETGKRTAILKLCAAICISLNDVSDYLELLIAPVYRECERKIVEEDSNASSLKNLALEVMDVIKSKVGTDAFTAAYAAAGKRIVGFRQERKRKRAVELVAEPAKAAMAKIRRQQQKKLQRKRKIATFRPEYGHRIKRKKQLE